jgi:TRAP-type uncharacterized transport system fused permease subunit
VQSQPVGHIFSRSWHLLTNNWVLLVPGLLIGVASGILSWLLVPADNPETVPGIVRQLGLQLLSGIIVLVAQIATTAYTTGMAGVAWAREKTSLADGLDAFARDGVNVFVAMIGLGIVGVVAIVLAPCIWSSVYSPASSPQRRLSVSSDPPSSFNVSPPSRP